MTDGFVSCLTVARGRLVELKEVVRCYCNQTHPSRELLVAVDGGPRREAAVADFLQSLGRDDIEQMPWCEGSEPENLAKLAAHAAGDLICAWPERLWSHSRRLEAQLRSLASSEVAGCRMGDHLELEWSSRQLRWVDAHLGSPETLLGQPKIFSSLLGQASREVSRLRDVGYLAISILRPEHEDTQAGKHRSAEFVQQNSVTLRQTLTEYRLPRPFLMYAQDENDKITALDLETRI